MRLQDSQANCGPYALKNGLAAMGIERSAEELEKACKTSATNGTSTNNIVKAAKAIEGCHPVKVTESRADVALLKLSYAVTSGRAVVISWCSQDPGDHWVAAVGKLGDRYLIADAGDSELVTGVDAGELLKKWRDGKYYEGVIL